MNRRSIQVALAVLWLLDGALQLQHQMFTSNFASQVIAAAAQGQPRFVGSIVHFGIRILLIHPAVFNALFAAMQLGLGCLILWRRTTRLGLLFSVAWTVIVWVFGEGFGGILSGHTLLLMGAPGAVLLYGILALAVLPQEGSNRDKVQRRRKGQSAAYWLALVWLVLWVGGSAYQLAPGQDTATDLRSMIATNAADAPSLLATLDGYVVHNIDSLSPQQSAASTKEMDMSSLPMSEQPSMNVPTNPGYGGLLILLLAALQLAIGLGVLAPGIPRKIAIWTGIALSLVFWVVGQNLGGYYTGLATDPNSGPLFVLLGLAILGCADLDPHLAKLGGRITRLMVGGPERRI